MALPDFLIIGTMKGGTTSLFRYLDAHPDVFMPATKELHFFVTEWNWSRGLSWYEDQFRAGGDRKRIGEASASYTNFPLWSGVPGRIKKLLPDVRLIYVLRDPLERMKSQYRHEVIMGRESREPGEALSQNTEYLFRSRYCLQLEQYLEHFDRARIHLLKSEDLRHKQQGTLRDVLGFLELEPLSTDPIEEEFHRSSDKKRRRKIFRAANSVPGYKGLSRILPQGLKERARGIAYRPVQVPEVELSAAREEALLDALRPDVKKLAGYMPDDFDGWGLL